MEQKKSELTLPPDGHQQKHHLQGSRQQHFRQEHWSGLSAAVLWRTEDKKVRAMEKSVISPFKTRELPESTEQIVGS